MTIVANNAPNNTSLIMLLTEVTTDSAVEKITSAVAFGYLVAISSAILATSSLISTALELASFVTTSVKGILTVNAC